MPTGLFSRLKLRVQNHPLGTLAVDLKTVFSSAREINGYDRRVVTLKPAKPSRGNVLLCYDNLAFLAPRQELNDHTRRWEARQIAQTFVDLGYEVDVIGENNVYFLPAKHYSIFVGNRINFDRIAVSLNPDCLKILHIDTAHWLFHNTAEHRRLLQLQERRGFTLLTRRSMQPNMAIEHADCATILGNEFTIGTYSYANKPMYRVPISAMLLYPWPEDKDFEGSRRNFLWLGSDGFVHKGLDLVLEAFCDMPDCHLTVCGPLDMEKDFQSAYRRELYQTPNIHTFGWVDVASQSFLKIAQKCIGLVYPSCSEGGGGSVIGCMHAGLIPIVSREASVDIDRAFGWVLKDSSIAEMKHAVQAISRLPAADLRIMAHAAWNFARANHTRERFDEVFRNTISGILKKAEAAGQLKKNAIPPGLAHAAGPLRNLV